MSVESSEIVGVPRAELDALKAELTVKPVGAFTPIPAQAMTSPRSPVSNSPTLGEYVSDRLVRFPGKSWQEIEALPQPLRWTVQRTIFHLLDEPIPSLCDPFPADGSLPGAYELHLPSDDVTLWYTVTRSEGREVISVQHVRLDT